MSPTVVVLLLLGLLIYDFFWTAALFRMAAGRFSVLENTPSRLRFSTAVGTFELNRPNHLMTCRTARGLRAMLGPAEALDLATVVGLEYRDSVDQILAPAMFHGPNRHNVLTRFHDHYQWFSLVLVTNSDLKIALYVGGQYNPNRFMMGWYFALLERAYKRLGWQVNPQDESEHLFTLLQRSFPNWFYKDYRLS